MALKKVKLGKSGLEVTELCFGVLPMGPIQKDLPKDVCVDLLRKALEAGINFFDTAELYKTQPYLGEVLEGYPEPVVVATKSTAETYEDMRTSVERSFGELRRDVIDIYHLHAARVDEHVFEERSGAIQCLKEYKEKGKIKAIGISTHNVRAVEAAAEENDIDVIFPLINRAGRGLLGGTVSDMVQAIGKAAAVGKGVYAMKALAGGHLLDDYLGSLDFVRNIPGIHSLAIGMVESDEIECNVAYFSGADIPQHLLEIGMTRKRLLIAPFCIGCGTCVETCPNGALSLVEGKATVDHNKCILCGYCNPVCEQFAIRLV